MSLKSETHDEETLKFAERYFSLPRILADMEVEYEGQIHRIQFEGVKHEPSE